MSEDDMDEQEEPLWVRQGFYGAMEAAEAAWAAVVVDGVQVGALVPLEGGPAPVDEDGEDGMFAVWTRPGAPVATPAGMKAARPDMVGRMVGA
jgi:hypothetical protein